MLAHRVIPVMLQRGSMLVKGKQFCSWRNVGHAQQAVAIHQARGVDELIYLDISATPFDRSPNYDMVEALTAKCFMPITVGGGVRSTDHVRKLLRAGADKVAICTAAIDTPDIVNEVAYRFGSQAVVVALDVSERHGHRLVTHCGANVRDTRPGINEVAAQARAAQERGAGEVMITSVDREGAMEGYDLDLISEVSAAVDIPVIAHGGAGTYEHMAEAIRAGASAVAAGSMFQFTDQTPREAAQYLHEHGIEARV